MRQFTNVSVSKWEDPRASALTSYSMPANQTKIAKYARVLGSAPLKQPYQLSDDGEDDDEESSQNSGDDDAGISPL